MINSTSSEEIDLKRLAKNVLSICKSKKKIFLTLLAIILSIAISLFLIIIMRPSYKANILLKSKYLKYDQLNQSVQKYNYYLSEPASNTLSEELSSGLIQNGVTKISVIEAANDEDINKEKKQTYKLYRFTLNFKRTPNRNNLKVFDVVLSDMQSSLDIDNEIAEERKKLNQVITELDSLIQVAYSAGNSYKNKIESGHSGQLLVMNDLYKGINELISQKVYSQNALAMLNKENIVFFSSPIVVSKSIEYPWLIITGALIFWFIICFIWVVITMLFSHYE